MPKASLTTYVALLRGINVGGGNKISMAELKQCFEALGSESVRTYINSGNVIFKHQTMPPAKLAAKLERAIQKTFNLEIRVLLRTKKQLEATAQKIPAAWLNDANWRTEIFFLWPAFDQPGVLAEIPSNSEVDNLIYVKGAVIWHLDRQNYQKSGLRQFIGTPVYKNMTGRNVNTLRKLELLLAE